MRLFSYLGLVALSSSCGNAFSDTSPFFMFSTSELLLSTRPIESSSSLTKLLSQTLSSCSSNYYIIVSAAGVDAADYSSKKTAPSLHRYMTGKDQSIRSSVTVKEVAGAVGIQEIETLLRNSCGVEDGGDRWDGGAPMLQKSKKLLLKLDFPTLGEDRFRSLAQHDAELSTLLDVLPVKNFTVLYTTTPPLPGSNVQDGENENFAIEMNEEFQESLHIDLRRDVQSHQARKIENQTLVDGPLFERYQFLSPGLFMSFFVAILLLSILFVAVRGVASLEVSYAAFDKDMGPAAQKKAQ